MITGIVITVLSVAVIVLGTAYYLTRQVVKEQAGYITELEQYLINARVKFASAYRRIKEVDLRGAFETDDEVGYAYKEIRKAVEDLDEVVPDVNFNPSENDGI